MCAYNDWCAAEVNAKSPRLLGAAILSALDTDDAVNELHRVVDKGFHAVFLPTAFPEHRPYNNEIWEPLWAAARTISGSGSVRNGASFLPS